MILMANDCSGNECSSQPALPPQPWVAFTHPHGRYRYRCRLPCLILHRSAVTPTARRMPNIPGTPAHRGIAPATHYPPAPTPPAIPTYSGSPCMPATGMHDHHHHPYPHPHPHMPEPRLTAFKRCRRQPGRHPPPPPSCCPPVHTLRRRPAVRHPTATQPPHAVGAGADGGPTLQRVVFNPTVLLPLLLPLPPTRFTAFLSSPPPRPPPPF